MGEHFLNCIVKGCYMKLIDDDLVIRKSSLEDLKPLWEVAYRDNLEWTKWNGPYFNDPIYTETEFLNGDGKEMYLESDNIRLIVVDDEICGIVSYHFADGKLRKWIEFGIVIFDQSKWGKGIGRRTCKLWMEYLFNKYPEIPHLGFTTWSGNERMMALGEKLGMKLEARIRKVRFYDGKYWDSIKYGILREEYFVD